MHMLMNVACRRMFLARRIVEIKSGSPKCEGQTLRTSHAINSPLLALTTTSPSGGVMVKSERIAGKNLSTCRKCKNIVGNHALVSTKDVPRTSMLFDISLTQTLSWASFR